MAGLNAVGEQAVGTNEVGIITLTINDLRQANRLEQVSVSQTHNININELQHNHSLEVITLTQIHNININELQHDHTLAQGFLLSGIDPIQNPPSQDRIQRAVFGTNNQIGKTESTFTLRSKTFEYHGERWEGEFELMPLDHVEFAPWKAWVAVVEGQARKFFLNPPHQAPRGAVSQNGTVDSFTKPRQLTIGGLSANTTNIFKRGDYIQLLDTDQLLMVTQDADSDGSGQVVVEVNPLIRTDPTIGSDVETQTPQGLFRLTNGEPGWSTQGNLNELSFKFVEAVGQ